MVQYCCRATSRASWPNDIAWMNGWIIDEASGPRTCAPSSWPVSGSAITLQKLQPHLRNVTAKVDFDTQAFVSPPALRAEATQPPAARRGQHQPSIAHHGYNRTNS